MNWFARQPDLTSRPRGEALYEILLFLRDQPGGCAFIEDVRAAFGVGDEVQPLLAQLIEDQFVVSRWFRVEGRSRLGYQLTLYQDSAAVRDIVLTSHESGAAGSKDNDA